LCTEHPKQTGRLSLGLEWCFDAMVANYDHALTIALRHRFITRMVMFATVALTIALFSIIPKGFIPQQDTELILGVDTSPEGVAAAQEQVIALVLKDPAVAILKGTALSHSSRNQSVHRSVRSCPASMRP